MKPTMMDLTRLLFPRCLPLSSLTSFTPSYLRPKLLSLVSRVRKTPSSLSSFPFLLFPFFFSLSSLPLLLFPLIHRRMPAVSRVLERAAN
ncbi:uncharacterized protein K444DRAFT_377750 [Hyaloscypha bicolor E]|uniref:Transmembrane protein n=1 Tax=Hyaloscypha bicolor E TaxID=1095630 RepID=A0A2J6TFB8_9HELO|nr:uncharacterized protein K444DRAFT_377750 [Hyaloscypha bicolor E]PMD61727.1 hypothetical protein K444DRAFT_377750 [Hyaloscypha bicolor E]